MAVVPFTEYTAFAGYCVTRSRPSVDTSSVLESEASEEFWDWIWKIVGEIPLMPVASDVMEIAELPRPSAKSCAFNPISAWLIRRAIFAGYRLRCQYRLHRTQTDMSNPAPASQMSIHPLQTVWNLAVRSCRCLSVDRQAVKR